MIIQMGLYDEIHEKIKNKVDTHLVYLAKSEISLFNRLTQCSLLLQVFNEPHHYVSHSKKDAQREK